MAFEQGSMDAASPLITETQAEAVGDAREAGGSLRQQAHMSLPPAGLSLICLVHEYSSCVAHFLL